MKKVIAAIILTLLCTLPNVQAAENWISIYKQDILSQAPGELYYPVNVLIDLNLDGTPEKFNGYFDGFHAFATGVTMVNGKLKPLTVSCQDNLPNTLGLWQLISLKLYRNNETGKYIYLGYDHGISGAGQYQDDDLCAISMSGTTVYVSKLAQKSVPVYYENTLLETDMHYEFKGKTVTEDEYNTLESAYFSQFTCVGSYSTYTSEYGWTDRNISKNSSNLSDSFSLVDQQGEDSYIWNTSAVDKFISAYTPGPVQGPFVADSNSVTISVNGTSMKLQAYLIHNQNYIMLRDIARMVNGTAKQFDIAYDSSKNTLNLKTGEAYSTPTATQNISSAQGKAVLSTSGLTVDSKSYSAWAYNIDGSNYFKLRDIAAAIGFDVHWDSATNSINVDTSKSYSG